jgi:hypothetical protein
VSIYCNAVASPHNIQLLVGHYKGFRCSGARSNRIIVPNPLQVHQLPQILLFAQTHLQSKAVHANNSDQVKITNGHLSQLEFRGRAPELLFENWPQVVMIAFCDNRLIQRVFPCIFVQMGIHIPIIPTQG